MSGIVERLYDRLPIALQNAVVSGYGWRARRERFGSPYRRWEEFLQRSERFGREELDAYKDERLRDIVRWAYDTVPYYRELFDGLRLKPGDVTRTADLPKLPVLSREDVVRHGKRLISVAVPPRQIRRKATSGTTGSPLAVSWDRAIEVANNACLWRARRWAGFRFGRPYATLMGRLVVPGAWRRPPFWRRNAAWNQLLLSPLHLTDETGPLYLKAMEESRVEALDAYPSSAYLLARYAESEGKYLPLTAVFTSGEPLLPLERSVIEARFRCRVFDSYGQAERVMFSNECEEHAGHHVCEEYGITELLDAEGNPVSPGTMGRIVATGLHNRAMPLIRYAVGDASSIDGRTCRCGRALALCGAVTTKAEDIIVTPEGRMVPPSLIAGAFKPVRGIERSQLVQHDPERITVRLVPGEGFSPREEATLEHELKARLGPAAKITFEHVAEIPLSARGKYRWIISTVPLRWGTSSTANLYADGAERPFGGRG